MQWRVTQWFSISPLYAPSHLYTALLPQTTHQMYIYSIKANSLLYDISVSLFDFWWRSVARSTELPTFPICLGCSSPFLTCWGGPRLFGGGWWGARGWQEKCFVAAAYCWCCLISWVSYLFGCQGAAVTLTSWKAAWFGQLSMSSPILFISVSLTLFNHSDLNKSGRNLMVK